jgi:outer membrane protein
MKKTLLVVLMMVGVAAASNTAMAQGAKPKTGGAPAMPSGPLKIGYFDLDATVSLFPDLAKIDTLMYIYQQDSLAAEYDYTLSEYKQADTSLKDGSIDTTKKTSTIYKMTVERRDKNMQKLLQWQQYSQQRMQAKQQELLAPYYNKALQALQVVIQEGRYTYVFKKDVLWMAPEGDNLLFPVARKLGLKIPTGGQAPGIK